MTVPHDLNPDFVVFECYFENLISEIAVHVKLVERFGEQFSLERKVHADRAIETDKPSVERYVAILAFGSRCVPRSTKILAILRYQDPILVQQNSLEIPIFPAGLADPHDMRGLMMAALAGHQSKF